MLAMLCAIIQAHPAQSLHELILQWTINNYTPPNSDCQAGCNMLVVAAQRHKGLCDLQFAAFVVQGMGYTRNRAILLLFLS